MSAQLRFANTRATHGLARCFKLFLLTVFCLVLGATTLGAQDWKGVGRARGKVSDEQGKPIVGAKVSLMYKGGAGPVMATDKKGEWAYIGLITGNFRVVAEAEGYIGSEGEIRVVEYSQPQPLNIVLRKAEAAGPSASDRLMGVLSEGNAKLQAKDYAGARAKFAEVLAEANDPAQQARLKKAIADTYLEEGKNAEARAAYQELMGLLTDPAAHLDLTQRIARSYYGEGNIDESVKTLEQLLVANPQDIATLRLIIDILVASGRETQAEPYMARLPQGEKVDVNALLNLGITAYNAGDADTALLKFAKVIEEYPENADGQYYYGMVAMGKAQYAAALAAFEKMLALAPDHKNATDAKSFVEYLKSEVKK